MVLSSLRTRNEGRGANSLSLTNGPGDLLKMPPKSGMNNTQYLTPQISNRPSTSGDPGTLGRNRLAQAFRERVKS